MLRSYEVKTQNAGLALRGSGREVWRRYTGTTQEKVKVGLALLRVAAGERDGDAEAALGAVLGRDCAVVKTNGFCGDGETEAGACAVVLASRGCAEEGAENIAEHGFRNAGAAIENFHDQVLRDAIDFAAEDDLGARRGVANRVTESVVDGAA
jgi:hypothetical protein